ncbi:MAG: PKD domain-containing protein [Dehalococcoidia bacterium]
MKKWLIVASLLALLAILVAGCGGPSPTPSATATSAAAPLATSTPTPSATATSAAQPLATPTPTPSAAVPATVSPVPTPTPVVEAGNFRLLISDDRLAIGDFDELLVTIEKIGVRQVGGSLHEFVVPVDGNGGTVDLTELQGSNAQEILTVDLADGEYTGVIAHVGDVTGKLAETGDSITLKLPSSKLKINKSFEIAAGGPAVDFVFDIAVVAAGSDKSPQGIKYLLLPVIGKSGPNQSFDILDTEAPTADAGEDQTVATGAEVQLDGSGSSDPEDDDLTYSWTLSVPEGSSATLMDANTINPTFDADVDGTYVATLVVNDGTSDSAPDTAEIAAEAEPNEAPTAHAGEDQAVTTGDTVQLDGSGSSDPENDDLTYSWTLTVPEGSTNATLSDANTVNPTFVPDVDGTYVATLVVNDGTSDSAPDTVEIAVEAAPNAAPTADAGADQAVTTEDTVQLDGAGSSDPENDSLTYTWTLSVPEGSTNATLSNANIVNPTFIADVDGTYVATLVVSDGTSDSEPDTVEIEAEAEPNEPPTADAGADQAVTTGAEVLLNGSNSSDPEDDDLTYAWTLSDPDGNDVTLSDANIFNPTFVPDVDGTYVATLVVNDGTSDSDPDTVEITATTL